MNTLHRRLVMLPRTLFAAAPLLALLASACASAPIPIRSMRGPAALPVSIVFTGAPSCPTVAEVRPEDRCPNVPNPKSCLKAKRGDTVVFASSPAGLEFTLYFDPFKHGALDSKKGVLEQKIDPSAPYKAYSYNLTAPGCPIVDPIIIIDP